MRGKQFEGFFTRETVLENLFASIEIPEETELVPIADAVWRVTAKELRSVNALPVVRASTMDGVGVRSADFEGGIPDYKCWTEGVEYVRADTGDDFPDEYDTVIPIEEVDLDENGRIVFISEDVQVKKGDNVRQTGSSIDIGDLLIEENQIIRPVDLVCLAQGGIAMVPVRKKPVIAFIPTGSELVPAGVRPKRGENIDTNSLMIKNLLIKMGASPVLFPIVPDLKKELYERLDEALSMADIVVLNAGTAKGSEDFNWGILEGRGKLLSHYVAAAPGRPLATAVIDGKPVINLPGPPMAAFFAADWCLRAVIAKYLHIPPMKRPTVKAELMEDIKGTPAMATMCRIRLVKAGDGYQAYPVSTRKNKLPEAMRTNGLFVKDIGQERIEKGSVIEVELLRGIEFIG